MTEDAHVGPALAWELHAHTEQEEPWDDSSVIPCSLHAHLSLMDVDSTAQMQNKQVGFRDDLSLHTSHVTHCWKNCKLHCGRERERKPSVLIQSPTLTALVTEESLNDSSVIPGSLFYESGNSLYGEILFSLNQFKHQEAAVTCSHTDGPKMPLWEPCRYHFWCSAGWLNQGRICSLAMCASPPFVKSKQLLSELWSQERCL